MTSEDCTGDDMMYVVAWHDECDTGTDEMCSAVSRTHDDGHLGKSIVTTCDTSEAHMNHAHTQAMKVRKRRTRRTITSALSESVWKEMRKHIAGRDQHDGVT